MGTALNFRETPVGDVVRLERLQRQSDEGSAAQERLQGLAADDQARRKARRRRVADAVASAMKDWAIEKGATHYAHVFYPLTGLTAEKHDSFLSPDRRRRRARRVLAARS